MQNEKLISVIIPVYGVEKYIENCLDSVVKQTYKNLEIIVINDGTKDKSAEIAKDYASKDARIKVYDYPNGGLSMARNRGLTHACGDYIAFLDSDDWLDKDFYKKLAEAMETNNVDIVKCGVIETDLQHEDRISFAESRVRNATFDIYYDGFLWVVVWNALYKREIVLDVEYPSHIVHEDNYASGMYLHRAKKVVELKDCLYYYRKNLNGISKGKNEHALDMVVSVSRLKQDLENQGFYPPGLDRYIAIDIYHFIRRNSICYRVKAIKASAYKWLLQSLDLRRRILCWYLIKRKGIKVL